MEDILDLEGYVQGGLLAETEEGNVFVSHTLGKISKDLSVDLSNKRDGDLSVNLDLVSVAINLDGSGDVLVWGKFAAIPLEESGVSLEGGVEIKRWPGTSSWGVDGSALGESSESRKSKNLKHCDS